MTKRMLFTFLSIVFFLASCSYFGSQTSEKAQPPAGIDEDSLQGEQYLNCLNKCSSCEANCKDTAYYAKATSDQNENLCASIVSTSLKQDCEQSIIQQEAVAQLNKEKCLELIDESVQQTCLVSVAVEVAIQSNSVDKCNDATDQARCTALYYKEMAVAKQDNSYCAQISESERRVQCEELVEQMFGEQTQTSAEE